MEVLPKGVQQQLAIFQMQYKQLLDPSMLRWPDASILKQAGVQHWLFTNLFNIEINTYQPPQRHQLRVLKALLSKIEASFDDPEEDEISDDLMDTLSSLLCAQLPSEAISAQQKAYVCYTFNDPNDQSLISTQKSLTLLESRAIIASSGTTGLRTWEAALHLGSFLSTAEGRSFVDGKVVLELGAGTGLLSLLCAKHLGAAHVMATDGTETVVEAIESNIFLNGQPNNIETASLKWGYPIDEAVLGEDYSSGDLDIILGADVTYDQTVIPTLVVTLRRLMDLRPLSQALIAATIRNEKTWDTFLTTCSRFSPQLYAFGEIYGAFNRHWWLTRAPERNRLFVQEVGFVPRPTEDQAGPFYTTETPLTIVRVNRLKGKQQDPFAL